MNETRELLPARYNIDGCERGRDKPTILGLSDGGLNIIQGNILNSIAEIIEIHNGRSALRGDSKRWDVRWESVGFAKREERRKNIGQEQVAEVVRTLEWVLPVGIMLTDLVVTRDSPENLWPRLSYIWTRQPDVMLASLNPMSCFVFSCIKWRNPYEKRYK